MVLVDLVPASGTQYIRGWVVQCHVVIGGDVPRKEIVTNNSVEYYSKKQKEEGLE
jgi:hypothetical protein